MKPHPRIRKTVKWGGAAVTVLLVGAFIASKWRCATWHEPETMSVSFTAGSAFICSARWPGGNLGGTTGVTGWSSAGIAFDWIPSWTASGGEWYALIPLWPVPLTALLATTCAWRLDTLARRRAHLKLCPKCNYDRAGLADGAVCPECGRAPS